MRGLVLYERGSGKILGLFFHHVRTGKGGPSWEPGGGLSPHVSSRAP